MKKILLVLLTFCMLCGCQGKKEDNVIKIGAILPLTGYAAFNGQTCKEGLELALSEIDSIKTNYKFDFRCEDSKSSVKDAQMAYKKLRSFGTNYFVAFGGQFLLGFAPETNNQDVVLFAEGTPNMNILSLTNRCFRVYPNVEMVTDKIIEFFEEQGITNAGVVYLQNEAYSMYGASFKKKFESKGGNLSLFEGYDPSERDFKNIVNKSIDKGIQCIYVAGAGESTALFTRQLFTNPKTSSIAVIGDMSLSTSSNLEVIGELKAPLYIVDNYMTPEFIQKYKESYGKTPNAFSVYAYATPYIMLEAFNAVGSADPRAVYDYIRKTEFSTDAGKISFDSETCEPCLEMIINTIQ